MRTKETDKIDFIPNNLEMNDFFNALYKNIDSLSINYISDCNGFYLFLEGLQNLDCYKESEKVYYYYFYLVYKAKSKNNKGKLPLFLADRFSLDYQFDNYEEAFEYFKNEINEFYLNK